MTFDDLPDLPGHAGKCVLDLDNTGAWLVCTLDPSHQMNLKHKVNRHSVLESLHAAGLLRVGGYAEREVLAKPEAPQADLPAGLFGGRDDGDA